MKSYVFLNELDFSVLLCWNSTWGFYSTFYKRSWADYHSNATEALFFGVIFRKIFIKDCDLICLSAIFLSALIWEGTLSSRFQLFGKAANHVSRPVSVISLQSLRDEQHRWSWFFFPFENNLYLLPAHTRRSQQWRCCLVTFLSNKNQSCTERWE